MKTIHDSGPAGGPPAADFAAPLLAPASVTELRHVSAGGRWPKAKLTSLFLSLCEAERAVHAARTAGDPVALSAAEWKRCEAEGELTAEREAVADTFLAGLSHAIAYKPAEVADLLAAALASPEVRLALVPIFRATLQPAIDLVRGEFADLAGRVADLETATAAEVWR